MSPLWKQGSPIADSSAANNATVRGSATDIENINADVCTGHGVWFDAYELQQVLARAGEPS